MSYTDEQRAYHRKYYRKRRQAILEYLGNSCVVCGTSEDLQVDHVHPEEKSFNISSRLTIRNPEVRTELDKCQLLCNTHHEQKTAIENSGFTHGTIYGWMRVKCKCSLCNSARLEWHRERNKKRRKPPMA